MEFNVQQEQRVWERVMGAPRMEQTPPQTAPICAEKVKSLAEAELASACLYRSLANRVCPKSANVLRAMAQEESCHARSLMAVYFVLTGQKLCLPAAQKPCITCTAEELRRAYMGEKAAAEQYAALASAGGDHGHLLQCLARDESRHARQLLCVIAENV